MFKFNAIILPFLLPPIVAGSAGSVLRSSDDNIHHHRSLVALTGSEGFASFSTGDVVTTLPGGVTVTALKKSGGSLVAGEAMIFDSANPTGDDFDLGTPHEDFGGVGVGVAGAMGSPYENTLPKGKVLIVSEDEDSSDPDDNSKGGLLTFEFPVPQPIDSIGLLDNEKRTKFTVITADGDKTVVDNMNGGDNSYELIPIGKKNVEFLIVNFYGSGAITEINYDPVPPPCMPSTSIDFEGFNAGDVVTNLGSVTVKAFKRNVKKGPFVSGEAMIFDSSCPGGCTGDDVDLGTPNESFGGPGIGNAGTAGKPYENSIAHGKILIVSEDGDSTDPDDNEYGGKLVFTFDYPTDVNAIGILDNEKTTTIDVLTADGGKTTISDGHGGDNGFELVGIWKKEVVKMVLTLSGSLGVTSLDLADCSYSPAL